MDILPKCRSLFPSRAIHVPSLMLQIAPLGLTSIPSDSSQKGLEPVISTCMVRWANPDIWPRCLMVATPSWLSTATLWVKE